MLGPPIRRDAKKATNVAKKATDEQVAPGVFRGADGRFYTAIPQNELANFPGVWRHIYTRGKQEDWVDV